MKRKRQQRKSLLLFLIMLMSLLPGAVHAQQSNDATLYLPLITNQTAPVEAVATAGTAAGTLGAASFQENRIEINPMSLLLAPNQGRRTAWIEAHIYQNNMKFPEGVVTWEVSDPTVVALASDGNRVEVIALTELGSTMVTASYQNLRWSISVVIAQTAPNTRVIDHTLVIYGQSDSEQVAFLRRTPETESIQQDDLLISDPVSLAQPGLMVRVMGVDLFPDYVQVTIEPVIATDVFQRYQAQLTSEPVSINLGQVANQQAPAEGNTATPGLALNCEITTSTGLQPIDVTFINMEANDLQITTHYAADIQWGALEHFYLATEINATLSIAPELSAVVEDAVGFVCKLALPQIVLPIPLGGTPLVPKLSPELRFEGTLGLNGSLTVRLPILEWQEYQLAGVEYTPATGWQRVEAHTSGEPQIRLPDAWIETQVALVLEVSASLHFGLAFGLPGVSFLDVECLEFSLALTATFTLPIAALAHRAPPPNAFYETPDWELGWTVAIAFSPGINKSLTDAINRYLTWQPLPPLQFEFTLFSISGPLGKRPDFTLAVSPSVPAPNYSGSYTLTIAPEPGSFGWLEQLAYTGQMVEFWSLPLQGAPYQVGTATVGADGTATLTYYQPMGLLRCTLQNPRSGIYPCPVQPNILPNGEPHTYALHIRASSNKKHNSDVGAFLSDRPDVMSWIMAMGRSGYEPSDCMFYGNIPSSAELLYLKIVAPVRPDLYTVAVYDMGVTPNHTVIALVHDRFLEPLTLVNMTTTAPVPVRPSSCRPY